MLQRHKLDAQTKDMTVKVVHHKEETVIIIKI